MPSVDTPIEYVKHLKRQGFVLGRELGQGLSGTVYSAKQTSLNRDVAVKFFDSAFVRDDSAMRKRFSRESKLLAKFQHPAVPYVITEGTINAEHGKTPYFVMEYISGRALQDIIQDGTELSVEVCLDYSLQILSALSYAHKREIYHRDVKPGNIMINDQGRCFLIDFSIGVTTEVEPGLTRATRSGDALGTVAYTPPEQSNDASKIDGRSDIYAMGVVLFEMLTGRSQISNIQKSLSGSRPHIVESVETACAVNPEDRFQSADEFARALGGAPQIAALKLTPGTAICDNKLCPSANWSSNGYYRGPGVSETSTNSYCVDCGNSLKYNCEGCSSPISETKFCGVCGIELNAIPLCEKCGSYLTKEFINTDTTNGCRKCIRAEEKRVARSESDFDDDIPF